MSRLLSGRVLSDGGVEWADYMVGRLSDETPHADDQFFATGAPATPTSGTAVTPSGSADWLEGRQLLSVAAINNSTSDMCAYLWPLTPSSPPVTIESYVRLLPVSTNFSMVSPVMFTDGTTAAATATASTIYRNGTALSRQVRTGTLTDLSTEVLSNANTSPGATFGLGYYVRLIWKSANTWTWQISHDGVTWWTLGGASTSFSMTPTHFGVGASAWNSGDRTLATFGYVRVYEADLAA